MIFSVNVWPVTVYEVSCDEIGCDYQSDTFTSEGDAAAEADRHREKHAEDWRRQNDEWEKTS